MKTLFTLMLSLFLTVCIAQDKIYVHTATAANSSFNGTVIDHPDLNSNPNAKIVFSHFWTGTYNNNVSGLWYRSSDGRWIIYNENSTVDMVIGSKYNIFIADVAEVFTHVASTANQGTSNTNTLLDHPLLNGDDPGPFAVFSNYFNPNEVFNNYNHGFVFDTTLFNNRLLYNENFSVIPENAAFKVLVVPAGSVPGVTVLDHLTTAANTAGNITELDHPDLNNNPDAAFVFSHYYGSAGAPSNNNINKVLGAFYLTSAGRWNIFTEDFSAMPEGVAFDIIIADQEVLGVGDNDFISNISLYPNPATTHISIKTTTSITVAHIYNMLGQEVKSINEIDENTQIDVSDLTSGTYLIKVQAGESTDTLKFIKQ